MKTRADQVHSLLHGHFESALRARRLPGPASWGACGRCSTLPATRAAPDQRLSTLDRQVGRLAYDQDIFTRDVFAEAVRKLIGEMTSPGIRHVDLRVGVFMHRWPWIGSLGDAIGAFKAAMPGPETLTIWFLGAVLFSGRQHVRGPMPLTDPRIRS